MKTHFTTRLLTSGAELGNLITEWGELCRLCPDATPFQTPEWLLPWVEVFAPEKVRALEVRCDRHLVGLAPLLIYGRGDDLVLAFMGGGVSDYLNVLIAPQYRDETVSVLFEAISNLTGWTVLDLTDLPSHSVLQQTSLTGIATPHDNCSALSLPTTKEELVHLLSKRQRANLRNAHSRLKRAGGGQVEFATAETLQDFLNDLFRLHASRWSRSGEPGVLADEQTRAFHCRSAPNLLAKGALRLSRLRIKDDTVAVLYSLIGGLTLFCYMQGYDPDFAALSPGTQLMFSAMESAVSSGISRFDFLRGEEAYKRHWHAQNESTYRIQSLRSDLGFVNLLQSTAA